MADKAFGCFDEVVDVPGCDGEDQIFVFGIFVCPCFEQEFFFGRDVSEEDKDSVSMDMGENDGWSDEFATTPADCVFEHFGIIGQEVSLQVIFEVS